jgi:general secretion pathway protein J
MREVTKIWSVAGSEARYRFWDNWMLSNRQKRCRAPLALQRGFTLIEVLLAVTIFAIVLAAINAVFYSALRLRNKTAEALDKSAPMQQALTIIRRDLANIVPPGTNSLFGSFQTTATTNIMAGASTPSFFTTTGILDETSPFSEVQKVAYALMDPTNQTEGRDLVRLVSRNLLSTTGEQPVQQWLMGGLQSITFLYHDGTTWRDSWDSSTLTNMLPRAIKLQLQVVPEKTSKVLVGNSPVELVVPLMAQASTNSSSTTTQQ